MDPVCRSASEPIASSSSETEAAVCVDPSAGTDAQTVSSPAQASESTIEVYSAQSSRPDWENQVCRAPQDSPPVDCVEAWKQVDGEADAILGKSQDPIERNKD